MKKILIPTFVTCLLTLCTTTFTVIEANAKDMSNVFLNNTDNTFHNTHKGYLEKISNEKDIDKILEIIESAPDSYEFFTLTTDGVRVRQGPSISHKISHNAYKNMPEEHEFPGDMPMSVFGGIVGNTLYGGDENCSAWREVLAVDMGTTYNGNFLLSSAGYGNSNPSYICVDFIETKPVAPYLDSWVDVYFKGKKSTSDEFSSPIKVNNDVTLVDYLYNEYQLKKGDLILFSNDFYDGMADEEFHVYKFAADYAFYLQTTSANVIQEKVKLDNDGKKALEAFINKNERLQQ